MCSTKCFRMPTLLVIGITITIVLVFITGITLTNSLNISNIIKLREKVASDSVSASAHHHQQQGRDYNLLAANHPKNLNRNKIVIEIGLRNYSESSDGPINAAAIADGNVDSIVFSSNGVRLDNPPMIGDNVTPNGEQMSPHGGQTSPDDSDADMVLAAVIANPNRTVYREGVDQGVDISDRNPAMIDFEKREFVKKTESVKIFPKPSPVDGRLFE